MSLLGIDIGTSGCKAVIFSEEGRQLALAYEEYDYRSPQPGWAELDTLRVWEQVCATIRQAAASAGPDPIRALCVSSLGEAVVPVSADQRILGPSLLNFDERGLEFVPALQAGLPAEELYRINGNLPGNQYSLSKLLWLQKYQPELYSQTWRFLHWSGFAAFMLGAEATVDYSLANRSLLFDLDQAGWSSELLQRAGISREKLPPCLPSGQVIGNVSSAAAAGLGLPAGIPIVNGGHDQCCNSLGCGVTEPGQVMYGMGTYICAVPVFTRRPGTGAMIAQGLGTEHHAAPGRFVSFIYNQGGALVKWYRDTFAAQDRRQAAARGTDIYAALFAEMPAQPSRVLALPHFTATGPPAFIADSSGVLAGLHLDTPRGEILKALVESTTFYLRECFDTLPAEIAAEDFVAAGGGSKSDAWLQVCADILGRPFMRPQVSEAGALGAALLAGAGAGIFASVQEGAKAMVHPGRYFEPDPAMQRRYNERYSRYRQLYPLLREYLREL